MFSEKTLISPRPTHARKYGRRRRLRLSHQSQSSTVAGTRSEFMSPIDSIGPCKRARSRSDGQHQPFRSSPNNGGTQQQSGSWVSLLGCGCGSPSAGVKPFLTSHCVLFDNTPQIGYPRGVKQQPECLNQLVVFVFTRLPVFRPHLFLRSSFPLSSSPARTVSFSPHLLPLLSHLPSRPSKCLIFPMMI